MGAFGPPQSRPGIGEIEVFGDVHVDAEQQVVNDLNAQPKPFGFGQMAMERSWSVRKGESAPGWHFQHIRSIVSTICNNEDVGLSVERPKPRGERQISVNHHHPIAPLRLQGFDPSDDRSV